ncbi:MAG TPA: hypothetical protein VGN16_16090 [Acidobacteriaceae bacterium]|jgi:hypothetical protein
MSPPPRASSEQTPEEIAAAIGEFLSAHAEAALLEDGKVLFDLRTSKYELNTEYNRCTLHLWNEERNLVRRITAAAARNGTLRLDTQRFGQTKPTLMELVSSSARRTPTTRDATRTRYMRLLERVLRREFPEWKSEGFRTAMDLERSFGPSYTRGSLVRGNQAWAVIGVNENESPATIDGILTLGVLWLHHCREQAGGRRLYQGLKLVLPRGAAMLTLSRLAWMNSKAAQWELYELEEKTEELTRRDAADTGNLRTRLVHHPDEAVARERFTGAIAQVMELVPTGEYDRVEQRLRSASEMAFLLHGLEFARARARAAANSFLQTVEITVGTGPNETPLTEASRRSLRELVADLFQRRRAFVAQPDFSRRGRTPARRIGVATPHAAHSRLRAQASAEADVNPAQDPLYRAAPERWLESMLREDLAPLTRGLAREAAHRGRRSTRSFANDPDADNRGNREPDSESDPSFRLEGDRHSRVIPRLDPDHVYAQVPAIVGAGDRGLLDLLGVTADGRLAVIELKADDDLHFALQGLDYWIRVRHHHRQTADAATGLGEFQRHGYFRGVELSPLPPRLYLVAPALHIHPATEVVLRYLSPTVEWNLLALDERWRQAVRVIWRKHSGGAAS